MAESYTSKRVKFRAGGQCSFLLDIKKVSGLSDKEIVKRLNVSARTLADWKREKFSMSLNAVRALCKLTNRGLPKNIEIKDQFWYVHKAAKLGGLAVYKKYGHIGGDEEKRKERWRQWWEKEGKFIPPPIFKSKPIKKPEKGIDLAEFVGILMGDGGISKRQVTITLHRKDDKLYAGFVIALIKKLFSVKPGIYHEKKALADDIVVSRTELVKFCSEELGLKVGNKVKQQIDIPDWIKRNKKFQIACARGLIDTDGSIFTHRYKVNGKTYSYKKLAFTSLSHKLLMSTYSILKNLGLNPRLSRNREVWLDSQESVKNYFKLVNSHNPKHLKRYRDKL